MEKNKLIKILSDFQKIIYSESNLVDLNNFLNEHSSFLLENDPKALIGSHCEYFIIRKDMFNALKAIEYYQSLPYISMDVEDYMKELKEGILKYQKSCENSSYTFQDLEKELLSNQDAKIYHAIEKLYSMNARNYIDLINTLLKTNKNEKAHRLLLICLVEQDLNKEFTFYLGGVYRKINPSLQQLPFLSDEYNEFIKYIKSKEKNPDELNRKIELYKMFYVLVYPDNIYLGYDNDTIYNVISRINKELTGFNTSMSSSSLENDLFNLLMTHLG